MADKQLLQQLNNDILGCRKCPRLVSWRECIARKKRRAYRDWDYWGKPVPGFGDLQASIVVVGLAPGAHGSNRTGRMFTGDASGDFLYAALHRAGFANRPESYQIGDGLCLTDVYITAVCRCAPPGNKPKGEELENCAAYIRSEISLIKPKVIVALGRIAFNEIRKMDKAARFDFTHNASYRLSSGTWLVCSYHPSRQNTQTGRLTTLMFDQIWSTVRSMLDE